MASIKFYFDEMMPRKVMQQVTAQGYQVVRAVDVGMTQRDDMTEHLRYSTEHSLVLVTFDRPFAGRASKQTDHAGLICLTGAIGDVGGTIRKLLEVATTYRAEDVAGKVLWIK